jgi:hypothetical protein
MSKSSSRTVVLRLALLAVVGLLVAAFGAPAIAKSSAKPQSGPAPTATSIRVDDITTPGITVPSTPGSNNGDLWYVVRGTGFDVDLSFWGDDGTGATVPLPLSYSKVTTVTVTGPGGVVLGTVDVPVGGTSAHLSGLSIAAAANNVTITASAPGPKRTTISGTSAPFDVLLSSAGFAAGTPLSQIGGSTGAEGCNPTEGDPVCADLLPPASGFTTDILLSKGVCAGLARCGDSFVQALAGISTSPSDPATLVMKCDKSLCGGGAIHRTELYVELSPGSGAVKAPDCPDKGLVGSDQQFCVDYVQSTRDNAGDTFLHLLFTVDAKVRFP